MDKKIQFDFQLVRFKIFLPNFSVLRLVQLHFRFELNKIWKISVIWLFFRILVSSIRLFQLVWLS